MECLCRSADVQLRPLASDDHSRGLFELLSVLTVAPTMSPSKFSGKLTGTFRSQADI
jgi:hypothetical protein